MRGCDPVLRVEWNGLNFVIVGIDMDLNHLTTRSQQALAAAMQQAAAAGNPTVEPAHLLSALLTQEGGTAAPLLTAAGVGPQVVLSDLARVIAQLPSASGSTVGNPQLARSTHEALQRAIDLAGELGDEFVSNEHLVVGIATVAGPAADALSRHGATPDTLTAAFEDRKSTRLNSSHVKISYAVFCLKKKKTR